MAALTADVSLAHFGNPTKLTHQATGAMTFFKGGAVFALASGYLSKTPVAGTSHFLGFATKNQVATAQGDLIEFYCDGLVRLPTAPGTITIADVGSVVKWAAASVSDNYADLSSHEDAAAANTDIGCGQIVAFLDSLPVISITRAPAGLNYDGTAAAWI